MDGKRSKPCKSTKKICQPKIEIKTESVDLLNMQSSENKSKSSKARVHDRNFTPGKDLSLYSAKDSAKKFGKSSFKMESDENEVTSTTNFGEPEKKVFSTVDKKFDPSQWQPVVILEKNDFSSYLKSESNPKKDALQKVAIVKLERIDLTYMNKHRDSTLTQDSSKNRKRSMDDPTEKKLKVKNLLAKRMRSHSTVDIPKNRMQSHSTVNVPQNRMQSHSTVNVPQNRMQSHSTANLSYNNREFIHNLKRYMDDPTANKLTVESLLAKRMPSHSIVDVPKNRMQSHSTVNVPQNRMQSHSTVNVQQNRMQSHSTANLSYNNPAFIHNSKRSMDDPTANKLTVESLLAKRMPSHSTVNVPQNRMQSHSTVNVPQNRMQSHSTVNLTFNNPEFIQNFKRSMENKSGCNNPRCNNHKATFDWPIAYIEWKNTGMLHVCYNPLPSKSAPNTQSETILLE
ncbi:uncharacterized protein LOC123303126 [Chrysoperla carnea]|uniref:uncharacterized protein LOC123303126 n=1 Tax=Chrysoperla carnea TaxID=189513 RepID=UPI001D085734|nr:uncharacterized protein LOC123303126 [Chrysoperla carnea]XP_044742190.1 uncharacterized protein LOC123303126 [Chrysoperla carnea]